MDISELMMVTFCRMSEKRKYYYLSWRIGLLFLSQFQVNWLNNACFTGVWLRGFEWDYCVDLGNARTCCASLCKFYYRKKKLSPKLFSVETSELIDWKFIMEHSWLAFSRTSAVIKLRESHIWEDASNETFRVFLPPLLVHSSVCYDSEPDYKNRIKD